MTHCSTETIELTPLGQRHVQADFNGGRLTSDAGVLLLREIDQHIGLTNAIDHALNDPRDQSKIDHEQRQLLAQRILALALGYEDVNDHITLRHDPALQIGVGHINPTADEPLGSSSTLCRLENRVTRAECVKINEIFVDQFMASFDDPPEEIILDFDATDDPLHGNQEGRFFQGYYKHYCYLPLYVFSGDELLCAYLRPSNIDASKHTRAILGLLVRKLRLAWPSVKIMIRADSGFCRWRLMRWCDRHEVSYILGLARNKRLERMSESFAREAESEYERTGLKQRHFHEIDYAAGTWDRDRRVIVKAEHLPRGRNLRYVVTNLDGDPQPLYDTVYCQRGEMENRIKEQQLGLFADRTSCSRMIANQFRLLLSSAAYVLMQAFRRTALRGTDLARAQVSTIRLKVLKIAARVVVSVRRIVLHLATSHPSREIIHQIVSRWRSSIFTPL